MSKNLIQFRYFGENNSENYPTTVGAIDYQSGEVFYDYLPIVQLGIQTIPGVKFYLNDSTYPIVIGNSGVYDLMADGTLKITKLQFDKDGLERIAKERNNYLIIDILYGKEA